MLIIDNIHLTFCCLTCLHIVSRSEIQLKQKFCTFTHICAQLLKEEVSDLLIKLTIVFNDK